MGVYEENQLEKKARRNKLFGMIGGVIASVVGYFAGENHVLKEVIEFIKNLL